MAIHVTRPDGTVAGFPDDRRALAEAYAKDVNGVVTDVSDAEESAPEQPAPEQPAPEQPLD